jgi:hypothetical protein
LLVGGCLHDVDEGPERGLLFASGVGAGGDESARDDERVSGAGGEGSGDCEGEVVARDPDGDGELHEGGEHELRAGARPWRDEGNGPSVNGGSLAHPAGVLEECLSSANRARTTGGMTRSGSPSTPTSTHPVCEGPWQQALQVIPPFNTTYLHLQRRVQRRGHRRRRLAPTPAVQKGECGRGHRAPERRVFFTRWMVALGAAARRRHRGHVLQFPRPRAEHAPANGRKASGRLGRPEPRGTRRRELAWRSRARRQMSVFFQASSSRTRANQACRFA